MFQKAVPVFAQGKERQMNCHVIFRETTGSLQGVTLYITAYSFFRLWVNGKFVFFGPSRAAGGYARVESIDLSCYDDGAENEIIIDVTGYACGSLATVDQPSFLAAELRRGEEVLLYTGRDFTCYCPGIRVQKVERYSVQRHFGEVWDYTVGDPFAEKYRVPAVPVETKLQWLPATPKPCFDYVAAQDIHSTGTYTNRIDPPKKNNSYSWATIPESWGYFKEEEISSFPYRWLRSQKMTVTSGRQKFPVNISQGEYALMDLGKIWCGFLELSLKTTEDTVLVVGFSELCERETFAYTQINMQNVIEYTFPAGTETKVLSFEPYTCRDCVVMVKQGAVQLKGFGMYRYEYDSARILPRKLQDPQLQRIYGAAVRTFCHNVVDIYMDCPSRERAGWLCDSYFMGKVEYFLTGETAVEDAYLENYRLHTGKGNLPEGILPECYPSDFEGNFIPQWNLWYILEVYEYLTQRNRKADKELFRKSIYGILSFMEKYENSDGMQQKLPSWNFVEWSKANTWVQDVNYPTNFLYAQALQCAAELYGDEALLFKAETLRKTTREKSFNGEVFLDHAVFDESGTLKNKDDFSEAGQYYAILFGGVDLNDPQYTALKDHVLRGFASFDPSAENYVPVNMFIGYFLRLLVLMEIGEQELLGENIKKKFAPMLELTDTLWEYNFHQRNGSYDHGFSSFAAIAAWIAENGETQQNAQK